MSAAPTVEEGDIGPQSSRQPGLEQRFLAGMWEFPVGDAESRTCFALWQAEFAALGWVDGKLRGVGSRDDLAMATYMVERGIRTIEEWLRSSQGDGPAIVTGADIAVPRVRIGDWNDCQRRPKPEQIAPVETCTPLSAPWRP